MEHRTCSLPRAQPFTCLQHRDTSGSECSTVHPASLKGSGCAEWLQLAWNHRTLALGLGQKGPQRLASSDPPVLTLGLELCNPVHGEQQGHASVSPESNIGTNNLWYQILSLTYFPKHSKNKQKPLVVIAITLLLTQT